MTDDVRHCTFHAAPTMPAPAQTPPSRAPTPPPPDPRKTGTRKPDPQNASAPLPKHPAAEPIAPKPQAIFPLPQAGPQDPPHIDDEAMAEALEPLDADDDDDDDADDNSSVDSVDEHVAYWSQPAPHPHGGRRSPGRGHRTDDRPGTRDARIRCAPPAPPREAGFRHNHDPGPSRGASLDLRIHPTRPGQRSAADGTAGARQSPTPPKALALVQCRDQDGAASKSKKVALANLPMYARIHCTLRKVTLSQSPVWVAALRAATRKAREQLGNQPKAVSSAIDAVPGPWPPGHSRPREDAGRLQNGPAIVDHSIPAGSGSGKPEPPTTASWKPSDKAGRIRLQINKHLHNLGGPGSQQWSRNPKATAKLPVHCTADAANTVSWLLLEQLSYHNQRAADDKLETIRLWTTPSIVYETLEQEVGSITRQAITAIPPDFAAPYAACGKIRRRTSVDPPIVAWCNFFRRPEWPKMPPRQRGLFEPLINDIVRRLRFDVSVH